MSTALTWRSRSIAFALTAGVALAVVLIVGQTNDARAMNSARASPSPAPAPQVASPADAAASARGATAVQRRTAVCCDPWTRHALRHPGPASGTHGAGSSTSASADFVRIEGRTWSRTPLDESRLAQLPEGGTLDLHVSNRAPNDRLRVHLFLGDEREPMACSGVLDEEEIEFDGLAPGDYRAVLGLAAGDEIPLDEQTIHVSAGQRSDLELRSALAEPAAAGSIHGWLTFAQEFRDLDLPHPVPMQIDLVPVGGEREAARSGWVAPHRSFGALGSSVPWQARREFRIENVPPGAWKATLSPFGYRWDVVVLPGRTTEIVQSVAAPAVTRVGVLDPEEHALSIDRAALRPSLEQPGDVPCVAWLDERMEDGRACVISAPGVLCIAVEHEQLFARPLRETVRSGPNEVFVTAFASARIIVECAPSEAPKDAQEWAAIRVDKLSPGAEVLARSLPVRGARRMTLRVAAGERYQLHFPAMEGREASSSPVLAIEPGAVEHVHFPATMAH